MLFENYPILNEISFFRTIYTTAGVRQKGSTTWFATPSPSIILYMLFYSRIWKWLNKYSLEVKIIRKIHQFNNTQKPHNFTNSIKFIGFASFFFPLYKSFVWNQKYGFLHLDTNTHIHAKTTISHLKHNLVLWLKFWNTLVEQLLSKFHGL